MAPTREQLVEQVWGLVAEGSAMLIRESEETPAAEQKAAPPKQATAKRPKKGGGVDASTEAPVPARPLPFKLAYQSWYTRSLPVVKLVLPDRYAEFVEQYTLTKRKDIDFLTYTISDYMIGLQVTFGGREVVKPLLALTAKFQHQILILRSCADRLHSVLSDIQGLLRAELFDNELSAAEDLLKKGHVRAAGALAGVTLERHLASVAHQHGIKLAKKEPTIADFNEALKEGERLGHSWWRSIQRYADLRNLAVHSKSREPTVDEIEELIRSVERTIKTLF